MSGVTAAAGTDDEMAQAHPELSRSIEGTGGVQSWPTARMAFAGERNLGLDDRGGSSDPTTDGRDSAESPVGETEVW